MMPSAASAGKYDGDGMWIPWPCPPWSSWPWSSVSVTDDASSDPPDGMRTRRPCSSSVYLRCQKSSRASTSGISAKLYSGGGDGIDHSSVPACHGSLPDTSPAVRLRQKFQRLTAMPRMRITVPIVEARLKPS
jgi:hypothetical protein